MNQWEIYTQEEKSKDDLKIYFGKRVEIKNDWNAVRKGWKGTVKCLKLESRYDGVKRLLGIEFDSECYSSYFHNLDGNISENKGYYVVEDLIAIIENDKDKKKIIEYKAGMSIDSYVDKLFKIEKDEVRLKWLRAYKNCVLPKEVKELIEEALTVVLRRGDFDKWGLTKNFEKGITNSIMLYGKAGCGKTMVAEAIAGVLGKNLIKIDNGDIQSSIPGQAERNMTKNFELAKKEDAVILFDEVDSLLYDRNSVGNILSAEINHLLGLIENFDGVIIMTTNRLHKLDEALQRRIIAKIEIQMPPKEGRIKIWKKLIPEELPTDKLDYQKLAEAELSGGEIKNCILLASRKALAKNKDKVTMDMFEEVIKMVLKSKEDYERVKPKKIDNFSYIDNLKEDLIRR